MGIGENGMKVQESTDSETEKAIIEGHLNSVEDDYFGARPAYDHDVYRVIFRHGFERGYRTNQCVASPTAPVQQEPVVEFMGRRLTPEGTRECWGILLCDPKQDPPKGTKLYTTPPTAPDVAELVEALKWALSNINCEPFEWSCEDDCDSHRAARAALAKHGGEV